MSGSIWKGGWHPEGKGGKKESWRGDFKGINQIAGKFGKGKEASASEERENHVSQPLTSLKDPSLFAPPPKHIHYHGAAAVPNATTPDTRGWGAPLPQETIQQQQHIAYSQQAAAAAEEEEKPPPGPYRKDTTGLSTANLPKPPVRRIDNSSPAPPPPPRTPSAASGGASKPAPRLPPRLPPRQNSRPDVHTPEPPPTYHEAAQYEPPNQGAMNRLGQAGVNVPGFDIGRNSSPQPPARTHNPTPPGAPQAAQVNELQSRFAKMTASHQNLSSTSSTDSRSQTQSPSQTQSQGTTWAQKQAALNTANSFHKDPSKVSFSDAKSAASTANNFRERHGEQVSSGVQTAKGLSAKYGQQAKDMNEKYGITNKARGYASSAANYNRSAASPAGGIASSSSSTSTSMSTAGVGSSSGGGLGGGLGAAAGKKAAPPPPPPKKREFMAPPPPPSSSSSGGADGLAVPPPLPLSSKPR